MEKVLISWSGGKDCTLALHEILSSGEYQVAGLLTTITPVIMIASICMTSRYSLLESQAEALGLPLGKGGHIEPYIQCRL